MITKTIWRDHNANSEGLGRTKDY